MITTMEETEARDWDWVAEILYRVGRRGLMQEGQCEQT